MLAQVAVKAGIPRHGHSDGRGDEAVGFIGGRLTHHAKDDLTLLEPGEPLFSWDEFAVGREDAGNSDEIESGNARVSQGQLEAGQFLSVCAFTLGEENFFGDQMGQFFLPSSIPYDLHESSG